MLTLSYFKTDDGTGVDPHPQNQCHHLKDPVSIVRKAFTVSLLPPQISPPRSPDSDPREPTPLAVEQTLQFALENTKLCERNRDPLSVNFTMIFVQAKMSCLGAWELALLPI